MKRSGVKTGAFLDGELHHVLQSADLGKLDRWWPGLNESTYHVETGFDRRSTPPTIDEDFKDGYPRGSSRFKAEKNFFL